MRATLLAIGLLLVAGQVLAHGGEDHGGGGSSFTDAAGDADADLDLRSMEWEAGNTSFVATITVAGAIDPQAAYTAIVYFGGHGATEPAEWYVLHHGPSGDSVHAGHADGDPEVHFLTAHQNSTLTFRVDRVSPHAAACNVMVARSATYSQQGIQVQDRAPSSIPSMEDSWQDGALCVGYPDEGGPDTTESTEGGSEDNGIPSPAPAGIVVLLVALASVLRRR